MTSVKAAVNSEVTRGLNPLCIYIADILVVEGNSKTEGIHQMD